MLKKEVIKRIKENKYFDNPEKQLEYQFPVVDFVIRSISNKWIEPFEYKGNKEQAKKLFMMFQMLVTGLKIHNSLTDQILHKL